MHSCSYRPGQFPEDRFMKKSAAFSRAPKFQPCFETVSLTGITS
jgi:hypothetical protein